MKRVKCIETCSTVGANYLAGQEYEVLDAIAYSLAQARHVVIVKPTEAEEKKETK